MVVGGVAMVAVGVMIGGGVCGSGMVTSGGRMSHD